MGCTYGWPSRWTHDLLTVLAHEVGHVVGLGHVDSSDNAVSVMAAPLTSGVRRLPTEEDRTAFAVLLGALPGDLVSPIRVTVAEVLQAAAHSWETDSVLTSPGTALLVATGSTLSHDLLNGGFTVFDPSASSFGWTLTGSAVVEDSALVLREATAQLSRATQATMIPQGTESLRLTLHSASLSCET